MKNIIHQFYYEGLGSIFYKKPVRYIEKKVKNKNLAIFLTILIRILYTTIILFIIGYILYKKWPF